MKVVERTSVLRMALRHVHSGRDCIVRQRDVIAILSPKKLPTDEVETVLHWLQETQRKFEEHYQKALSKGLHEADVGYRTLGVPPSWPPIASLSGFSSDET